MTQHISLTRRNALIMSMAGALLAACGNAPSASGSAERASAKLPQIGLQTYTLRESLGEDFVGTFEMIKDVGYDYVELNGRNFEDRSAAELRKILDGAGLPAPASHVNYDSLANAAEATGDYLAELGCNYAILPWVNDDQRSADDYKRHAAMLNRASEAMSRAGVRAAYHNHQFEFYDLGDGVTGMDILLSETDASLVDFEIDLFWALLGDADVPHLFKTHPGRFKLSHIKDMKGSPAAFQPSVDYERISLELMVNVGEGDIDFASLFSLNDISGMQYFIAEHDNPPLPYRQSIETSLTTLKALRFKS